MQSIWKQWTRAKFVFLIPASLALALILSTSPIHAQATGATDIDITLPDIVILHYYSNVDVTISSTALGNFLTGTPGDQGFDEGIVAPVAGGFTQNLGIGPTALTGNPGAAVLTLQNAWAVRSLSLAGGTNTQLSIANTNNTLSHITTTATITISSVAVNDGATSGASITFAAPGLLTPRVGDVQLTLNLNNAVNAGDYLNGIYTLTATNL